MTAADSVRHAIINARATRGLTQDDLAKILCVSQSYVAKLKAPGSNPTVDTIARVASALGMRVDFNFHRDGE